MSKAEIDYIVRDYMHEGGKDFEKILAAMGAFENELELTEGKARPLVELRPIGNTDVLMALSRTILEKQYHSEAVSDAEILREDLEQHFDQADRARLSKRFAGFVVPKGLIIE